MSNFTAFSQKPDVYSAVAMNAAGLHYTGNEDTARCNSCNLEVNGWTKEMQPFFVHAQGSPQCPFVLSKMPSQSICTSSSTTVGSSAVDEISFRGQAIESVQENNTSNILVEVNRMKQIRKQTFSHWPHRIAPSVAQMIEAGFFSCNVGDRVICLYCNLICQQWLTNMDDPCEIHKQLSPKCPFVVAQLKRPQTVSMLTSNEDLFNDQALTSKDKIPHIRWFPHATFARQLCLREMFRGNSKLKGLHQKRDKIYTKKHISNLANSRLDLSISKSLIAEGFDSAITKSCYENQFRLTNDDFSTDADLRIACTILQKQIEYIDGKKENIIIPSAVMAAFRMARLTVSQDADIEMTIHDHGNESAPLNLHSVAVTNATHPTNVLDNY